MYLKNWRKGIFDYTLNEKSLKEIANNTYNRSFIKELIVFPFRQTLLFILIILHILYRGRGMVIFRKWKNSSLLALPELQKTFYKTSTIKKVGIVGCGGRIWTYDLQVMSLTSYRAAPPRANIISKKKTKLGNCSEVNTTVLGRPGNDLLFHTLRCSTIGAESFHYRVRNGIGCSPFAIITRSS